MNNNIINVNNYRLNVLVQGHEKFKGAAAAGPVESHAAAADPSFRSSQFINRFNKVQQMNQDMARGGPDCWTVSVIVY